MTDGPDIARHRWRAPRRPGTLLHDLPLTEIASLAESNRRALAAAALSIDGHDLRELRALARHSAFEISRDYLSSNLSLVATKAEEAPGSGAPPDDRLWFACGHQPLLAHPGVWIKNLAVAIAARLHGGVGLNMIVDHDVIGARSIAMPTGGPEAPALASLPFDGPAIARPGEDSLVEDLPTFESFGSEATSRMEAIWGFVPMVGAVWPAAARIARESRRLPEALTRVRVDLEREHGLGTLECPMSALARTDAFLHFVRHAAANAETLREAHNRRLGEYRRLNRIRSRSHPVADLAQSGSWCESPFWFWREDEAHRGRLFVRTQGDRIEFGDGETAFAESPAAGSLDALRDVAARGIRVRPRALMTTMFVRLFLADVFIHGIGGAKYDELTDAMMFDFLGLAAPKYVMVTGTFPLPLSPPSLEAREQRIAAQRDLRAAHFNAERLLRDPASLALAERKYALIARLNAARAQSDAPRGVRKSIGRELRDVEEELARGAVPLLGPLRENLAAADRRLAANRILENREFAAVLHPLESYAGWISATRQAATGG